MNQTFSPRRTALLALLLPLAVGCAKLQARAPAPPEDYARARKSFRTKLTRQAPAPQEYEALTTPADATRVDYTSGGLKLAAFLGPLPHPRDRLPAVLVLHGGFAYGEGDWQMTLPFRDAGFVVLMPVLRGENGQPGAHTLFYDEVDDVLAAAEVLAAVPGVDPTRIFITGHSAGGTLAMLAAQASRRFRAATALSGSPDQAQWLAQEEELVPFSLRDAREVEMRSPLAFATSFKCPTRLFFGSEEPFFKSPSEETVRRARRAGLDVEAVVVEGDHFTSVPEAIARSIRFFRQQP